MTYFKTFLFSYVTVIFDCQIKHQIKQVPPFVIFAHLIIGLGLKHYQARLRNRSCQLQPMAALRQSSVSPWEISHPPATDYRSTKPQQDLLT